MPPVAGDITSGASFTASSGSMIIDPAVPVYINGCTLATTAGTLYFNNNNVKGVYLKSCVMQLNGNNSTYNITSNVPAKIIWDSTTVQFANAGQGISCVGGTH